MGTFPAYALLEIFSFYVDQARTNEWQALVHVCQRWRYVVLSSPRRLNLRLLCTTRSPVRRMLDIWPPLPLVISNPGNPTNPEIIMEHESDASDILSALGHKGRIEEIILFNVPRRTWHELVAAMQEPLPALKNLSLWSDIPWSRFSWKMEHLSASFLGGSAPLLQSLHLDCVPYQALPILLSSARDLVDLQVSNMPDEWYISPNDMVACLSPLTRLTTLVLGFESQSHICPSQVTQRSSQQKRTVLHSLTRLNFRGLTGYLEDLVARIDAPRLTKVMIMFVEPIVSADISQLSQFIGQADSFQLLNQADIVIYDTLDAVVKLRLNVCGASRIWCELIIPYSDEFHRPPSTLAQVCVNSTGSFIPSSLPISTLEHLTIRGCRDWWPTWGNLWLEFLTAFTAVKNLYLSEDVSPHLLPVLNDVIGESSTGVLPALQNLFLEGYYPPPKRFQEAIEKFTTVRRLAGSPIAVGRWKRWST